ncbi:hypothetical protein KEM54_004307 [Ascosphaera aggregata]|nr:hypothetical protein KEM54_004307 [Ascosphaera aggregata]
MYRRTLAASYICRQDELPPDELIEDIFAGGDGFKGGWDTFMTSRMGKSNGAITASNSSGLAASSGHPDSTFPNDILA